ncbi:NUDIX hydrolase [Geomicrobium sediminis]|uniref:Isopentenyldiphosphate isomerase n=1 Tax=Geomicrobium sediminis TaxID=1347788 RepID=A0ABS2PAK9_9BACL|nr:NUDIX domain-containing protein [Geomicrobium sediminis]MBM7632435.1 isopentenyldiphosphate isomerase [Geomicrobium sediminis]
MEYLDVFDKNYKHIGVEERTKVHQKGLWHHTFHCWLIKKEHDETYVLFQKRSNTKEDYPDLFDISAAGHLEAGETPNDGVREVEEELGLSFAIEELDFLGVIPVEASMGIGKFDREYCYTYSKLVDDQLFNQLKLDTKEVESVSWFSLKECEQLLCDNEIDPRFVPHPKAYYQKVIDALSKM